MQIYEYTWMRRLQVKTTLSTRLGLETQPLYKVPRETVINIGWGEWRCPFNSGPKLALLKKKSYLVEKENWHWHVKGYPDKNFYDFWSLVLLLLL